MNRVDTDGNLAALRAYEREQDRLDCMGMRLEAKTAEVLETDELLLRAVSGADPELTIQQCAEELARELIREEME